MDYFERKLDDKNRLTIPAELRAEFPDGHAVITRGFDKTIHLYPKARWDQAVERELAGFSIISEEGAKLNRQLRAGKTLASLDTKQGRVTIEQHLLDWAGIKKDLTATRIASTDGSYWAIEAK